MKRSLSALLTALCLSLGFVTIASAETYAPPDAKVAAWYPDGWSKHVEGLSTFINPKDESLVLMLTVIEPDKVEKALTNLDVSLSEMVKDLKPTGQPTQSKLNGMPATTTNATGTYRDKPIEVKALVVFAPSGKALIVVGLVKADAPAAQREVFKKILASIKPTP